MTEDTTVPPSSRRSASAAVDAPDVAALVVVWSLEEPHRVGESAVFPDLHLEHVLGRGPGDGRELRVEFGPRRPGEPVAASALAGAKISRRQLLVTPGAIGFEVEMLGSGALRVDGVRTSKACALFAETIELEGRLLLYVTRRPTALELRYLPAGARGVFGRPDPFGIVGESASV